MRSGGHRGFIRATISLSDKNVSIPFRLSRPGPLEGAVTVTSLIVLGLVATWFSFRNHDELLSIDFGSIREY
jgi:hypothetical protein